MANSVNFSRHLAAPGRRRVALAVVLGLMAMVVPGEVADADPPMTMAARLSGWLEYQPGLDLTSRSHDVDVSLYIFATGVSNGAPGLPRDSSCEAWGNASGDITADSGTGTWGGCDYFGWLDWDEQGALSWERTGSAATLTMTGPVTGNFLCLASMDPADEVPIDLVFYDCVGTLTRP